MFDIDPYLMWCRVRHLFYELPRGDGIVYNYLSPFVHHECPSVNLLLFGHVPVEMHPTTLVTSDPDLIKVTVGG